MNLTAPVDVGMRDAAALRAVARARAVEMARGPEVLLLNTDSAGAPLALNMLLNLHRLGYCAHTIVVAYDDGACATLAAAAARLPLALAREIRSLPCVFDSWWDRHMRLEKTFSVTPRQGSWMVRWAIFARLVRLGYNVLSFDTDGAVLDDMYPHLHAAELCGRFTLMYASDYELLSPWLQTGFVYACGAARDGAAAYVIAEVVDRYLRMADACGGAYRGGTPDADGTVCPPGSWLLAARGYDGLHFDQYIHRGVVHSCAMRDGRMWWSQLEDMSSTAWPWAANRSACLEVEASARSAAIHMPVRRGPPPPARAAPGVSRGAALARAAPTHQWTRSDLLPHGSSRHALTGDAGEAPPPTPAAGAPSAAAGSAAAGSAAAGSREGGAGSGGGVARGGGVALSWGRRFGLGAGPDASHDPSPYRSAHWANLRPAVTLATQLPYQAGAQSRGWWTAFAQARARPSDSAPSHRAHGLLRD